MLSDDFKIRSLFELSSLIRGRTFHKGKTGLICGCFDILHIGHLRLFKFAKSKVDLLIVGLDSDASIHKTKGRNRPINPLSARMEMMAALNLVDFVFPLEFASGFGTDNSTDYWTSMLTTLHPDALITSTNSDRFHQEKHFLANLLNIEFMPYSGSHKQSTTDIETILLSEN
jgi:cytidyltransferase-like protein